MSIEREVAPEQVGFDAKRLAALDAHFARYVDDGRLAGWQLVVSRRRRGRARLDLRAARPGGRPAGRAGHPVAHLLDDQADHVGRRDDAVGGGPLRADRRDQPVAARVRRRRRSTTRAPPAQPFTVPAVEPIRVWHLLTHTSGLTYGFLQTSVVDALYRKAGYDIQPKAGVDLAQAVPRLGGAAAAVPARHRAGATASSTDVLGRLVEVVSGQTLGDFLRQRIFEPLGMTDTRWWVDPAATTRTARRAVRAEPARTGSGGPVRPDRPARAAGAGPALRRRRADLHRRRLPPVHLDAAARRASSDGVRLLGSRTVRFMTRNHLPGGVDLGPAADRRVRRDHVRGHRLRARLRRGPRPGAGADAEHARARTTGAARPAPPSGSTRSSELTVAFYTQLLPSSTYPIRPQLRQLVYSALTD